MGNIDLSAFTPLTIKIYAEKDGLVGIPEVMKNKSRLPQTQS